MRYQSGSSFCHRGQKAFSLQSEAGGIGKGPLALVASIFSPFFGVAERVQQLQVSRMPDAECKPDCVRKQDGAKQGGGKELQDTAA